MIADAHAPISVTILDTVTGKCKAARGESWYYWSDGNGSCDCNRGSLFDVEPEIENICSGCHRFLIIDSDTGEFPLTELNPGYPKELLDKHMPKAPRRSPVNPVTGNIHPGILMENIKNGHITYPFNLGK